MLVEKCPYCEGTPVLSAFGDTLYPYKRDYWYVWICPKCRAYVGCHTGTTNPKGFLANEEYRLLRKIAHSLFDPIWQDREMSRSRAYKRMADVLKIPAREAHISQLSIEQLKKLIRSLRVRRMLVYQGHKISSSCDWKERYGKDSL